jgi:hypothetical protein
VAKTFGIISPINNIRNVIIITWNINPRSGEFEKLIELLVIMVESTTMEILMKLFAIRILARSCSGFFKRERAINDCLVAFPSRNLRSEGFKEKKATSLAEITADPNKSKMSRRNSNNTLSPIGYNKTSTSTPIEMIKEKYIQKKNII